MSQITPTGESVRSPFENVFNFLGGLPQGHEKALKQALYNSLALFFLVVCCSSGIALFYVLEPFIKPLIWAFLCGSVLHPFKYSLSTALQRWTDSLSATSTPLFLGIIITPVKIIDDFSEKIGNRLMMYMNYIIGLIATTSILFLGYYYTPAFCICLSHRLGYLGTCVVAFFIGLVSEYVIVATIIGYLIILVAYWRPEVAEHFMIASYMIWTLVACYLSGLAGLYKVPTFFALQILLLLGLGYQVFSVKMAAESSGHEISVAEAVKLTFQGKKLPSDKIGEKAADVPSTEADTQSVTHEMPSSNIETPVKGPGHSEAGAKGDALSQTDVRVSRKVPALSLKTTFGTLPARREIPSPAVSNTYLYTLCWACTGIVVWRYAWFVALVVPVLALIYLIKQLGHYFGIWKILYSYINYVSEYLKVWCDERYNALFPVPVIGLYKIFVRCNEKVVDGIKSSIDTAASIAVILGLIIFVSCTSVFLAVQVYAEGINLVQIMGSTINNTLVRNSQLFGLLPEDWQDQMDTLVDNAYVYGREGISKLVKGWLKDVEPQKGAQLENQFLELWDRVYQAWVSSNTDSDAVGPVVTSGAVFSTWDNFVDSVGKSPELFSVGALISFGRENVETLLSLSESIWTLLKGNLTLAFDSVTALFAIVFGGGTAVINFFVNLVVFFTALFYLLSSSGKLYKPVDVITTFSPHSGSRFAVALEDAVSSVFKASFKMAAFHGLWTWMIHNLFQVNVVYIPTVISAALGAVPFLGPYWANIPAVLDLWFNQNRALSAALLFTCDMIVVGFVDSAIYQEITGSGHPYLTGLSVAGGIFLMGVEGAILGPILLCGMFVAVNMSSTLMTEATTSDSHLPEHLRRLSEIGHLSHFRRQNSVI